MKRWWWEAPRWPPGWRPQWWATAAESPPAGSTGSWTAWTTCQACQSTAEEGVVRRIIPKLFVKIHWQKGPYCVLSIRNFVIRKQIAWSSWRAKINISSQMKRRNSKMNYYQLLWCVYIGPRCQHPRQVDEKQQSKEWWNPSKPDMTLSQRNFPYFRAGPDSTRELPNENENWASRMRR